MIALGALVSVVTFLSLLTLLLIQGKLVGNRFPADFYLTTMRSEQAIKLIFGGALTILTVGLNILAARVASSRNLYVTAFICVTGLAACLILLIKMQDPELANEIWANSDPPIDYATLNASNQSFLTIIAAWLIAFLASVLGIALARKSP